MTTVAKALLQVDRVFGQTIGCLEQFHSLLAAEKLARTRSLDRRISSRTQASPVVSFEPTGAVCGARKHHQDINSLVVLGAEDGDVDSGAVVALVDFRTGQQCNFRKRDNVKGCYRRPIFL